MDGESFPFCNSIVEGLNVDVTFERLKWSGQEQVISEYALTLTETHKARRTLEGNGGHSTNFVKISNNQGT